MTYVDGCELHYDSAESQDEAAAQKQMAMDVLYRVGCQYGVKDADMVNLCELANVNFNELNNHSYKLNESTKCQSQQWSSDNLAPAKPQAYAI